MLPATGYRGRLPAFPLDGRTPAEHTLWPSVWRKPQAVEWARRGLHWQVAAYVRTFLEASAPGANAALKTAVLRQEDSLGISPAGMRGLRWLVGGPALKAPEMRSGPPVRRRLRALDPMVDED